MNIEKIKGLNTAAVTPMFDDGSVNYDEIDHYAEFIISQGLSGVFVCGSSGESLLLSTEERKKIVRRWMKYADRLNIRASGRTRAASRAFPSSRGTGLRSA